MEASVKTNIKQVRKELKEFGKRLTDEGIWVAANVLSTNSVHEIQKDYLNYLKVGTGVKGDQYNPGVAGETKWGGQLRSSVVAVVKRNEKGRGSTFGVGSNLIYAGVHEEGSHAYVIMPRRKKALAWGKITKVVNGVKHRQFIFKRVNHPGNKARFWMSRPMIKAMRKWLDKFKQQLEKKL